MLSRAARLLVVATGLLLACAGLCSWRANTLQSQAREVSQHAEAAGARFSHSFEASQQDRELQLLDERRALLLRASRWSRGMLGLLGLSVVTLFAAWVARELRSIREEIDGPPGTSPS